MELSLKPKLEINNNDEKEIIKGISIDKSKINGSVTMNIAGPNSSPEEKIQALIEENRQLKEYISEIKLSILNESYSNVDFRFVPIANGCKNIAYLLLNLVKYKSFIKMTQIPNFNNVSFIRVVIDISEKDVSQCLKYLGEYIAEVY